MSDNDLVGRAFGEFWVGEKAEPDERGNPHWLAQCSCGELFSVDERLLLSGAATSCGLHSPLQDGEFVEYYNEPFKLQSPRPPISPELEFLLGDVLLHPRAWLNTPNPNWGGRRPIDMVGTDDEFMIVDVLRAVDQGLF